MKPYISKFLFAIVFLMVLEACKVSKDVATPKPELPQAFRNTAAQPKDTVTIADLP